MITDSNWRQRFKLFTCLMAVALFQVASHSTPPNYTTFKRTQLTDYSPDPSEVLRVWMVYVAQGDGLLVQLPTKYNYDPDPTDGDNAKTERIEIVIDGGANPTSEASRMADFI